MKYTEENVQHVADELFRVHTSTAKAIKYAKKMKEATKSTFWDEVIDELLST